MGTKQNEIQDCEVDHPYLCVKLFRDIYNGRKRNLYTI